MAKHGIGNPTPFKNGTYSDDIPGYEWEWTLMDISQWEIFLTSTPSNPSSCIPVLLVNSKAEAEKLVKDLNKIAGRYKYEALEYGMGW